MHRAILALAFALLAAQAQERPPLRLKAGPLPPNLLLEPPAAAAAPQSALPRASGPRRHFILQFESLDAPGLLDELGFRDIRVLQYLPENALLVSAPESASLSGLGVLYQGAPGAPNRLSPLLASSGPEALLDAVLEVHPDVPRPAAVEIAFQAGLEILDHPDLAPNALLVRGPRSALQAAAQWDETSYIYPAAPELLLGQPVAACLGGLAAPAALPAAANLASSFGDGWDGPGRGAASLTVFFGPLPSNLDPSAARLEIQSALAAWAAAAQLSFSESSTARLRRQIDLFAAARDHGDGFPFDGRGGILAHTFYPPPNPETIAGDLHLDLDEPWRIAADVDLFSVALHELGHALGLGHNDDPNSVMYPYYRRHSGLQPADITEITRLYAARSSSPPATPPATPPSSPSQPSTPPSAPPSPPAPPSSPSSDTLPPSLQISFPFAPVYATSSATITIRGSASDNAGVRSITWSSRTAAGAASGPASAFSAGPVPLVPGINPVSLTATDAAGNASTRALFITRR